MWLVKCQGIHWGASDGATNVMLYTVDGQKGKIQLWTFFLQDYRFQDGCHQGFCLCKKRSGKKTLSPSDWKKLPNLKQYSKCSRGEIIIIKRLHCASVSSLDKIQANHSLILQISELWQWAHYIHWLNHFRISHHSVGTYESNFN